MAFLDCLVSSPGLQHLCSAQKVGSPLHIGKTMTQTKRTTRNGADHSSLGICSIKDEERQPTNIETILLWEVQLYRHAPMKHECMVE